MKKFRVTVNLPENNSWTFGVYAQNRKQAYDITEAYVQIHYANEITDEEWDTYTEREVSIWTRLFTRKLKVDVEIPLDFSEKHKNDFV